MQCQQLVRLDIEFINRKRNLRADDDSLAITFHLLDSLQLLVVELRPLLHNFPQLGIFFINGFEQKFGHAFFLAVAFVACEYYNQLFVACVECFLVGNGCPWLVKLMVPKALRGKDIMYYAPEVPKSKKFIFILVCCGLLCLLLPMAAPLIMSFFLGMAIKESEIVPYQDLVENTLLYTGTLMLGLLLGTLCEASTLLNPKVAPLIVLGVLALAVSGAVGILGGYVVYWFKKGDFNPVVGIAGVSCVPTTAKIAQHAAEDEDPFSVVMPVAMGANIGGVIVSAIACGVFIATIGLVK